MSIPRNPAIADSTLLFQMAPGILIPYEYQGVRPEISAYQTSAWIGTSLMISPIYDVYGPDVIKFFRPCLKNQESCAKSTK